MVEQFLTLVATYFGIEAFSMIRLGLAKYRKKSPEEIYNIKWLTPIANMSRKRHLKEIMYSII